MTNPVNLNSSTIASADYDADSRTLTVVFVSGGSYEYSGVDADTANGLMSSASPGSFYSRQIKGRFQGKKI